MKKFDIDKATQNPNLNPAKAFISPNSAALEPIENRKTTRRPWDAPKIAPEPRKKRFQIYVTDKIDAALRAASKRTGKPVNQIINEILTAELLGEEK